MNFSKFLKIRISLNFTSVQNTISQSLDSYSSYRWSVAHVEAGHAQVLVGAEVPSGAQVVVVREGVIARRLALAVLVVLLHLALRVVDREARAAQHVEQALADREIDLRAVDSQPSHDDKVEYLNDQRHSWALAGRSYRG